MSNEELAVAIQAGATELMGELWQQVAGLIKWKANHIMTALDLRGGQCGVEFDDLMQTGYLALAAAVGDYTPGEWKFTTYLDKHLKTAFADATGFRTQKGRRDPVRYALSLDKPLGDEPDGDTLSDIVEDPRGAAAIEQVEELLWNAQLKSAVDQVLRDLPEGQRAAVQCRYWDGLTYDEAGAQMCIQSGEARNLEARALRQLRKPQNMKRLRPFYDFDYYSGTGLRAFKSGGASIQERYVIHKEQCENMF